MCSGRGLGGGGGAWSLEAGRGGADVLQQAVHGGVEVEFSVVLFIFHVLHARQHIVVSLQRPLVHVHQHVQQLLYLAVWLHCGEKNGGAEGGISEEAGINEGA